MTPIGMGLSQLERPGNAMTICSAFVSSDAGAGGNLQEQSNGNGEDEQSVGMSWHFIEVYESFTRCPLNDIGC